MAGTPYWRERKLVTSSSERKPNFTRAEARRAGHPAAETYLSCIPTNSEFHAKPLICRGNQRRSIRTDTNCQPNGHSAKVTSVRPGGNVSCCTDVTYRFCGAVGVRRFRRFRGFRGKVMQKVMQNPRSRPQGLRVTKCGIIKM